MKQVINKEFLSFRDLLNDYIINFDTKGEPFGNQDRNSLKLFKLNDITINAKSFRIPNVINQIVYKHFRKSKAQRSYEYALKLEQLGIGTPKPIAYFEFSSLLFFRKSYYLSEHLDCELTFRELNKNVNFPNHEKILRAFTRFTFIFHEQNILFLDHSPGNTLIKKTIDGYNFYLVDLNRMEFRPLSFETRIKNFERLSTKKFIIEIMSDEYAKCSGESYDKILKLMWSSTEAFQAKFHNKRRLKNKLKFWKQ